jgi:hypothetical protein
MQSLGNSDDAQLYVAGVELHKPPGHNVVTLSHTWVFREPPEHFPLQT